MWRRIGAVKVGVFKKETFSGDLHPAETKIFEFCILRGCFRGFAGILMRLARCQTQLPAPGIRVNIFYFVMNYHPRENKIEKMLVCIALQATGY